MELRDDLLVGVFGPSEHEKNSFTKLSKPEIIPYAVEEHDPGSSNWVVEESEYAKRTVYDEAFQLVKEVFEDEFGFASLKTTIQKFSFKTLKDFRKILKVMSESQAKHKVFIYDHSPENLAGLCGFVEEFSLLQNLPMITWGCAQSITNPTQVFNSTTLDLQPPVSLVAKSIVSMLRHFKWRRLAWLRSSGADYSSSMCNQLDKHMLSSDYFAVKVFESYNFAMMNNQSKDLRGKLEQFWKKVFQRDISG